MTCPRCKCEDCRTSRDLRDGLDAHLQEHFAKNPDYRRERAIGMRKGGFTVAAIAERLGVATRTVHLWLQREREKEAA